MANMMGGTWEPAPPPAIYLKPGAKAQDDLDLYLDTARPSNGLVARRVRSIELATASESTTTSPAGSVSGKQDPETSANPPDDETSVEKGAEVIADKGISSVTEKVTRKHKRLDSLEEIIRQAFDGNSADVSDEENSISYKNNELSLAAKETLRIQEATPGLEQNRETADYIDTKWLPDVNGKSVSNSPKEQSMDEDHEINSNDSQSGEKQHSPQDVVKDYSNPSSQYSTRDDASEKSNAISQLSAESNGKMVITDGQLLPSFTKRYFQPRNVPGDIDQWGEATEKFDYSLTDSQMTLRQTSVSSATLFPSRGASLSFDSTLLALEDGATEKDSVKQHWLFNTDKAYLEHIEDITSPRTIDLEIDGAQFQDEYGSEISSPPPEEDTYPEGGLKAWLVVLGGWCGMFASLGFLATLGAFQTYFLENQLSGHSPSQVAWIFSTYTFLVFGCGVYIGPLFDVYGPKWLLLPGTVLLVLMMFLLPYCKNYWELFFVFGVIGGVGSSLIFTPCIAAPGHWFHRRRGLASGIVSAGGACGGIVFPLIMQALVYRLGFTWTTRIMEIIMVFLLAAANFLIKSRLTRTTRSPHPDLRILVNPAFAAIVFGVFLLKLGIFIPLTYITSYAKSTGYDTAFAFQILPIMNAGSVFGRVLPGLFADKIGRYNISIIFIVLTIFSVFALWLPFGDQITGLVCFALLFGFASGSNISLTPVCIGQLCDTRDYGRYYATCYTIVSIGCLIGSPIAGVILENSGFQYWSLIVWTGSCYAHGLIAFIIARGLGGGWKFWKIF